MNQKIDKSNVQDIFELSQTQRGMLFQYLHEENSDINHIQLCLDINGPLQVDDFRTTLEYIQQSNEALRSVFRWENISKDIQIVLNKCPLAFEFVDLSDLTADLARSEVASLVKKDEGKRLDLTTGAVEFRLFKIADVRFKFVIKHHHILYDGWSTGILLGELFGNYHRKISNQPWLNKNAALKDVLKSIKDKPVLSQENYWKTYLGNYESTLLSRKTALTEGRPSLKTWSLTFDHALLDPFIAKHRVTKAAFIYAAFGILLNKYTGQTDAAFGIAVSNRNPAVIGADAVIHNLINTIPLRISVHPNTTLLDVVLAVQQNLLHEEFSNSVSLSEIRQFVNAAPSEMLFDTLLAIENYPVDYNRLQSGGLEISLEASNENTGYPLTLMVLLNEGIRFEFRYDALAFEHTFIEAFGHCLCRACDIMINDPATSFQSLQLLNSDEQQDLICRFNQTQRDYAQDRTIVDFFHLQARKHPRLPAVKCGSQYLSYSDIKVLSDKLAVLLEVAGVGVQDLVGTHLKRNLYLLPLLCAIHKVGAAYVPIDPDNPDHRKKAIIKDARLKFMVDEDQHCAGLDASIRVMHLQEMVETASAMQHQDYISKARGNQLAYVIYTSGTTGNPKGVMIEHHSVVNRLSWMQHRFPVTSEDVLIQKTPISFDVSVWELFWASMAGALLVIPEPGAEKDPQQLAAIMQTEKVSIIHFVPAMLDHFHHSLSNAGNFKSFPALRIVFASGEALKPETVNGFRELIYMTSRSRLINLYGPTEATVDVSCHECAMEEPCNLVPIGYPIDNTQFYIVDASGHLVPFGASGELCIAGVGLARGYLHHPALTEEKFFAPAWMPGSRLYRSGDLVRWLSSGELEYLGRLDHQVKIRGYRIELGEIESQLSAYPGIHSAVVLCRGEQQDKYLTGYYVSAAEIPAEMLRRHLQGRLPEYMVPAHFMHLHQMPLTANGKTDRRQLPEVSLKVQQADHVAAGSAAEQRLLGLYAEVLKLQPEVISVDKSFFELGGHSLRATVLISRIQQEFGVRLPLREVFTRPSVRALAGYLEGASADAADVIVRCGESSFYPLSSIQRRLYFLQALDPGSVAYNMPYTLRLEGEVDPARIERAFGGLLGRHESLRTYFGMEGGQVVQYIPEQAELEMSYYQGGTAGEEADQIAGFVRPFDLHAGPLLRVGLISPAAGSKEWLLLLDMHHIACDGVSQGVLIRDFMSLYRGEDMGPLALRYRDYAVWQQSAGQQGRMQEHRDFWLSEFRELPEALELPADYGRPAVKSTSGHAVRMRLQEQETSGLQALCRQEGCTLFMVLLSAYTILLSRLSNQEDIVVGTSAAGRSQAELQGIVGMFVNTLALRNYPKGELSYRSYLSELKGRVLSCFDHQGYQYEQLIDELKLERDAGRNPLFDVMFMFDNFEAESITLPGISAKPYPRTVTQTKFDLTLLGYESSGGLELTLEYSTALFSQATAERMLGYYGRILSAITADAQVRLSEIELLSEAERQSLLERLSGPALALDPKETVVSRFRQCVNDYPEKIALHFGSEQLTYRQLDERSGRFARILYERSGRSPNRLIGIMMSRSDDMVVAMIGVLKSGAAYLPIDPVYPQERIEYILKDSGCGLLITDDAESQQDFPGVAVSFRQIYEDPAPDNDLPPVDSSGELCYVIYTSGSTGNPKGVMITHGNVINFFYGMDQALPVTAADHLLAITSTSFDISVLEIFWTLCKGVEMTLHPSDVSLAGLDNYIRDDTSAPDLSLFFFSSYKSGKGERQKYDLVTNAVKYADQAGFKAVWLPERHFHEFGGLFPNPSVLASAVSMVTENIEIRSGSVVSPLHDALRIAEEWSVVDNLSNGRVSISFAPGWNPDDFALGKVAFRDRHQHMYAQVEEVRRLWQGGAVKRRNGLGKDIDVRIFPEPIQRELPVWITSSGSEDSFISAGKAGANILTHFLGQDVQTLTKNIQAYRQARKESGFDPGKVTLMLHTYVRDVSEDVEAVVKGPFIDYIKSSVSLSKSIFAEAGFSEDDLTDDLREQILEAAFRRYYKSSSLIGTEAECLTMIRMLQHIGVNEIACLIDFGIEDSFIMSGMARLKSVQRALKSRRLQQSNQVSILQSTPSFVKLILADPSSRQMLASLKLLLIGGEALPAALVEDIRKVNKEVSIYNMYGPTETTIWSCVHPVKDAEEISIGKPILNTQVYILNKYLKLQPAGVSGSLFIGGSGVARGYWNNQEMTDGRFIEDPFGRSGKIYNTGDIGRWQRDGTLKYIGRNDFQVKVRGFRVELEEIEKSLLACTGVKAVVVKKGRPGTIGDEKLVAYYTADQPVDTGELRAHASHTLPFYMVPGFYIRLDSFPLTANGKIDHQAFPDPRVQHSSASDDGDGQTGEERLLANIWVDVLGVGNAGRTDNFFALGGDSIKSLQIISKVKAAGFDLSVKDIFTSLDLGELATRLKPNLTLSDQSAVTGPAMLTPVQRWFFNNQIVRKHHFNQAVMLRFTEVLTRDDVAGMIGKLLDHHDYLRATFQENENGWQVQISGTNLQVRIDELDLRYLNAPAAVKLAVANSIQAGIDLAGGPLIRVALFHEEEGTALLLVVHHLVIDGISWRILFEDIDGLYRQLKKREPLQLQAKTNSFVSWYDRLEDYVRTKAFQKATAYWNDKSSFVSPLKRDYLSGINVLGTQKQVSVLLSEAYTQQLLAGSHFAFGTDVTVLLLAALIKTLIHCRSQTAVSVDLEGHGREEIIGGMDFSRTVGWFTSIYPVGLSYNGDPDDLAMLIKSVKEEIRSVPNHGVDYLIQNYHLSGALPETGTKDPAPIFFNYLGQFDSDLQYREFKVSYEDAGSVISPEEIIPADWDILSFVQGGRFRLHLSYSPDQYDSGLMHEFGETYRRFLEELLDFCCSAGSCHYTPSDMTFKGLTISELESIGQRIDLEDVRLLTPMQASIYFDHLLNPQKNNYIVQVTYTLRGVLDLYAVESSVAALIAKHDVLRTVFLQGTEQVIQVVLNRGLPAFSFKDLRSEFDGRDRKQLAEQYHEQSRQQPFSLSQGPLFSLTVIQTGDDEFEFIWKYHHILMDGWCIGILIKDFKDFYQTIRNQKQVNISKSNSYAAFCSWLESSDQEEALAYWREYLAGYEGMACLPAKAESFPGNGKDCFRSLELNLDNWQIKQLNELSARYRVSINSVVQTAWSILLMKYNDTDDVTFGAVVSGRPPVINGVEEMVGLFMNTIPVRVSIVPGQTVADVLLAVQAEALTNEPYHFSQLSEVQATTELGSNLLNHVMVFENFLIADRIEGVQTINKVTGEFFEVGNIESFDQNNYGLSVIVFPGDDRFQIRFDYNSAVYEQNVIAQAAEHLNFILSQMLSDPEAEVLGIDLISADEKLMLVESSKGVSRAYPVHKTLLSMFSEQAGSVPDFVAVSFGDQVFSYRQMDQWSSWLGRQLINRYRLSRQSKIGLLFHPSPELIAAILAVLKAGHIYVLLSPEAGAARNEFILRDCGAGLLMIQESLADGLDETLRFWNDDQMFMVGSEAGADSTNNEGFAEILPVDSVYIVYTSGSSGVPKGVEVQHAGLVNMACFYKELFGVEQGMRLSQVANVSFDAFAFEIWPSLAHGCRLHIAEQKVRGNPELMSSWLTAQKINVTFQTTAMAQYLFRADLLRSCTSLKTMAVAGETMQLYPTSVLPFKVFNLYGPTEDSVWTTWAEVSHVSSGTPYSIGRPIANKTVLILGKKLQLQPAGLAGEICISGVGLAKGYVNNPALTAQKFISDFNPDGERLYRTGDMGRWLPDGSIEFLGRNDNQVKIRGFRIELDEIEKCFFSYPHMLEATVIVREREGEKALAAYYVFREAGNEAELKAQLRKMLPPYMLPSYFVQLSAMPLNSSGKIDKKKLPDPDQVQGTAVETVSQTETRLRAIWSEVLNTDESAVSISTSFFEQGGHSLKAVELINKINRHFSVELLIEDIFNQPTIQGLADLIITLEQLGSEAENNDQSIEIII